MAFSSLFLRSSLVAKLAVLSFLSVGVVADLSQWQYYGCVQDIETRLLSDRQHEGNDTLTLEACAVFCDGSNYFGTQYARECWCGNNFSAPPKVLDDAACNAPCAGDASEPCGGWQMQMTVYSLSYLDGNPTSDDPPAASSSAIASSTGISASASSTEIPSVASSSEIPSVASSSEIPSAASSSEIPALATSAAIAPSSLIPAAASPSDSSSPSSSSAGSFPTGTESSVQAYPTGTDYTSSTAGDYYPTGVASSSTSCTKSAIKTGAGYPSSSSIVGGYPSSVISAPYSTSTPCTKSKHASSSVVAYPVSTGAGYPLSSGTSYPVATSTPCTEGLAHASAGYPVSSVAAYPLYPNTSYPTTKAAGMYTTVIATTYVNVCSEGLTTAVYSATLTYPASAAYPTISMYTTTVTTSIYAAVKTLTLTLPYSVVPYPVKTAANVVSSAAPYVTKTTLATVYPVASSKAAAAILYPSANSTATAKGYASSTGSSYPVKTGLQQASGAAGREWSMAAGVIALAGMVMML